MCLSKHLALLHSCQKKNNQENQFVNPVSACWVRLNKTNDTKNRYGIYYTQDFHFTACLPSHHCHWCRSLMAESDVKTCECDPLVLSTLHSVPSFFLKFCLGCRLLWEHRCFKKKHLSPSPWSLIELMPACFQGCQFAMSGAYCEQQAASVTIPLLHACI